VKEKFLRDATDQYPKAAKYLAAWAKTVRLAAWRSLADVRRTYPSADMVVVGSGKPALVFNVCGNTYRLIVAVHFDRQIAYTLRFLTHAEQRPMEKRIMKTRTKLRFRHLPKDYASLCRLFLPRPIRDSVDYANVAQVTDAMALWQNDFNRDQRDYFDLLCSLLEDYDRENIKWPNVRGVDILKHLLDEHGHTAADLSRMLGGSRNLGAMLLRGERNLTLSHIRKLAAHFKLSPEAFI